MEIREYRVELKERDLELSRREEEMQSLEVKLGERDLALIAKDVELKENAQSYELEIAKLKATIRDLETDHNVHLERLWQAFAQLLKRLLRIDDAKLAVVKYIEEHEQSSM